MEEISEQRLAQVHPDLASRVREMDTALQAQGINIRVVQGLRTIEEQDALYAQGRSVPGKRVTNARGGYSWHNFGCAVDCVPGIRGVEPWSPNWNASHPDFKAMIKAGVDAGLVSGANWVSIKDQPHFQLSNIPVSPTDANRAAIHAVGMFQFWKDIFAVSQ